MQKQHRECSIRKGILRNFARFTGKQMCQILVFNKVAGLRPATLLKKEAHAQVFSCEFCEISKNTFFAEHLGTTASVDTQSWHMWIGRSSYSYAIKCLCFPHIETSQLICAANKLTGFYMKATLALIGLSYIKM